MDHELPKQWVFEDLVPKLIFLKEKNLFYRAVLILDNAPSYPHEEGLISSGIFALFLLPIITSLLQSMFEEKI
jgi:hypothetical protein